MPDLHKNTIRIIISPGIWVQHVCLATAYSLAGRMEDARAETAEVLRTNPRTFLEGVAKGGYLNCRKGEKERFITPRKRLALKKDEYESWGMRPVLKPFSV